MDSLLDMGIEAVLVVRLLLRVLVEGIMDVERIEVIPWNVDIGMVVYVIASDVNGNTDVERPMEVGKGIDIGRLSVGAVLGSMVDVEWGLTLVGALRSIVDVERVTTPEDLMMLTRDASAEIHGKSLVYQISMQVCKYTYFHISFHL